MITTKTFYDNIHGAIELCKESIDIIDHPYYQRLRNIKQNGNLCNVFPTSSHSRFEHSIGVAYLSRYLLTTLKNQDSSLDIREEDLRNVEIAGLCHDLGHGPFSHMFDDMFLKQKFGENNLPEEALHENRSNMILERIVDEKGIDLTTSDLKMIKEMIHPKNHSHYTNYLYQIVSNKQTGIDVDKFDYISRDSYMIGLKFSFDHNRLMHYMRVINNELCFYQKLVNDVYFLFQTRYRLHKQVYSHPIARAYDFMYLDLLNEIDKEYQVSQSIFDVDRYCNFDDYFAKTLDKDKISDRANKLIKRINSRNKYEYLGEFNLEKNQLSEFKEYLEKDGYNLNGLKFYEKVLNFSKGNKSPLCYVPFYDKNMNIIYPNDSTLNIGILEPRAYEERTMMIFSVNKEDKLRDKLQNLKLKMN
jgi:HD superfamily phosphohydrolase